MKTKNLTLSEALKTGLPIRSNGSKYWIQRDSIVNVVLTIEDLMEPIWEVKFEPREFWAEMKEDGLWTNLSRLQVGEKITLREVLDEET